MKQNQENKSFKGYNGINNASSRVKSGKVARCKESILLGADENTAAALSSNWT